jgi:hypothetical protein
MIVDALGTGCRLLSARAAPTARAVRRRPAAASASRPSHELPAPSPPPDGSAQRLSGGDGTNCGFQVNERYLEWDDSAARRLLKLYLGRELAQPMEWVDERLAEIVVLLPNLEAKLARGSVKADMVLQLVRDTTAAAARLVALKEALGAGVDAAAVAAAHPWMLLDATAELPRLRLQMEAWSAALPKTDVAELVGREPMLLLCDVAAVLEELRRLLPGQDVEAVLRSDPGAVLDMQQAGLEASLTVDDGIAAK